MFRNTLISRKCTTAANSFIRGNYDVESGLLKLKKLPASTGQNMRKSMERKAFLEEII